MNQNQAMINIKEINIYHFLIGLLQYIHSSKIIHIEQHFPLNNYITKIVKHVFLWEIMRRGKEDCRAHFSYKDLWIYIIHI